MRQDQESLALKTLNCCLCHLLRRQDPVCGLWPGGNLTQQWRVHRLRAKYRYLDSIIFMSDRDILGKADRCVFRRGINRAADLGEQAGSGNGAKQIAAATRLHARYKAARCIDMPHHIDGPGSLPKLVWSRCRVFNPLMKPERDASIRAIKVDGPDLGLRPLD